MSARRLLSKARRRAGKTQRQLSAASNIPQATIARIESGHVDPRFGTVLKLLHACGYDVEICELLGQGVDRAHIQANLSLTPSERLARVPREAVAISALRDVARPRPALNAAHLRADAVDGVSDAGQ